MTRKWIALIFVIPSYHVITVQPLCPGLGTVYSCIVLVKSQVSPTLELI